MRKRDVTIVCLIVVLTLSGAAAILVPRTAVETACSNVELVIDQGDLQDLARLSGEPYPRLLGALREAGLTSVGVHEITLRELHRRGLVTLMSGGELANFARSVSALDPAVNAHMVRPGISPGHSYVLCRDEALTAGLVDRLTARLAPGAVTVTTVGASSLLDLTAPIQRLESLGLGLWLPDLQQVTAAGLHVAPRLTDYSRVGPQGIEAAFDLLLAGDPHPGTVIFSGYEVLGYPQHLGRTAELMARRGLVVGLVESPGQLGFILQRGAERLARETGLRAARVYTLPRPDLDELSPERAVDMWVRSAVERNIRVLYLRPFLPSGPRQDAVASTLASVEEVNRRVRAHGLTPGVALPFEPHRPSPWALWLVAAGTGAAGVVLVRSFFPRLERRWYAGLWLVGVSAWSAIALTGYREELCLATALVAALTFPSLGVIWFIRRRPPDGPQAGDRFRPLRLVLDLAVLTAVSTLGGLAVTGLLGGTEFMLELKYFRGVKLTYLGPVLVGLAFYLRRYGIFHRPAGLADFWTQCRHLLGVRFQVGHVLLGLLGLAVVVLAYMRSGNAASVSVLPAEVGLRQALDYLLPVRPRFKEFLVGGPGLFLAGISPWAGGRALYVPAILAVAVGQASVVNTFEHLRTSLLLSLTRVGTGLAAGIICGLIAAALVLVVAAWLRDASTARAGTGGGTGEGRA